MRDFPYGTLHALRYRMNLKNSGRRLEHRVALGRIPKGR
jgi:hypothetical protein